MVSLTDRDGERKPERGPTHGPLREKTTLSDRVEKVEKKKKALLEKLQLQAPARTESCQALSAAQQASMTEECSCVYVDSSPDHM